MRNGNQSCEAFRELLPELPDLGPEDARRQAAEAHAASCASCHEEQERLERVMSAFRTLPLPGAADLGPSARSRILAEAVRRSESAGRKAAWLGLAAAALISIGTVVALQNLGPAAHSATIRPFSGGEDGAPVLSVRMEKGRDGVRVRWADDEGKAYRVLRSSRPDSWQQAQRSLVKAHEWKDPDPAAGGRITFYRVETVPDSWR